MSDSIYVNFGKGAPVALLQGWGYGRDGAFGQMHERIKRADQILRGLDNKLALIRNDARLSAQAQRDDQRAAAVEAAAALQTSERLLDDIEQGLADDSDTASPIEGYKPNDFATVAIDLALAGVLQKMPVSELVSLAQNGRDPDLLAAMVRLPAALTGVAPELKQKAVAQAIYRADPTKAHMRQSHDEAMGKARFAYKQAFKVLRDHTGIDTGPSRADRVTQFNERLNGAEVADDGDGSDQNLGQAA